MFYYLRYKSLQNFKFNMKEILIVSKTISYKLFIKIKSNEDKSCEFHYNEIIISYSLK